VCARPFLKIPANDIGMLVDKFLTCHILLLSVCPGGISVKLFPDRPEVFQPSAAFSVACAVRHLVATFTWIWVVHGAHPSSRSGRSSSKALAFSAVVRPC
jgi:hypothetical protein